MEEDAFEILDRPEILQSIFFPMRDFGREPVGSASAMAHFIPIEENISISCRFYFDKKSSPNILYFHGNGEVASDYDDIGPLYTKIGANLFVADYRGYGSSGGRPTLSNMIKDAHLIFEGFKQFLDRKDFSGRLFVMGRSLGCTSAIELAYHYPDEFEGLIIEAGTADRLRLFSHLGIPLRFSDPELELIRAVNPGRRIRSIPIPTLVIHAEYDSIIPLEEGKDLYANSAAKNKHIVIIPRADHNTTLSRKYFQAIKDFISSFS